MAGLTNMSISAPGSVGGAARPLGGALANDPRKKKYSVQSVEPLAFGGVADTSTFTGMLDYQGSRAANAVANVFGGGVKAGAPSPPPAPAAPAAPAPAAAPANTYQAATPPAVDARTQPLFSLQRGPDGKLYQATSNGWTPADPGQMAAQPLQGVLAPKGPAAAQTIPQQVQGALANSPYTPGTAAYQARMEGMDSEMLRRQTAAREEQRDLLAQRGLINSGAGISMQQGLISSQSAETSAAHNDMLSNDPLRQFGLMSQGLGIMGEGQKQDQAGQLLPFQLDAASLANQGAVTHNAAASAELQQFRDTYQDALAKQAAGRQLSQAEAAQAQFVSDHPWLMAVLGLASSVGPIVGGALGKYGVPNIGGSSNAPGTTPTGGI